MGTAERNSSDESLTAIETGDPNTWFVISIKARVDSFSHSDLMQEISDARAKGQKKIALNLKTTRFLNLAAIKFCVEVARELADEGGGLALVACSERTKRHFEIYGSLDEVKVVRDVEELNRKPRRPLLTQI